MMINSVQGKKILSKKCTRYLAHIVREYNITVPIMRDTLMVQEFLDIFPESFSELTIKKKLEFSIKLALGTVPISKALFRIVLTELQKLKKQL